MTISQKLVDNLHIVIHRIKHNLVHSLPTQRQDIKITFIEPGPACHKQSGCTEESVCKDDSDKPDNSKQKQKPFWICSQSD